MCYNDKKKQQKMLREEGGMLKAMHFWKGQKGQKGQKIIISN